MPPQKPRVGGMKRFAWDSGETSNFRKKVVQNLVFLHFFENSPNMAPVKGGFGGFPNDISDVMQGSIYAYIYYVWL